MANLQNNRIFETYKSIVGIGSSGTQGVTGTPQALTDGLGVEIPIEVSETEVNVTAETLQVRSLTVDGYGEVINDLGEWTGIGATGSSGTSGTSGATGPVGPAGSQGTSGSTGSSGTSGSSGTRGTSGTSGSSGSSGTRGVAGSSGTSGTSGLNGDRYLTTSTNNLAISIGTKSLTVGLGLSYSIAQKVLIVYNVSNFMEGSITSYNPANGAMVANITDITGTGSYSVWTVNLAGASGGDGSSGTSGTSGTSGVNGTSGTSGINGTSGTSGVSGTDGSSGTSGSSGTTGTSGTSGIDGSSGTSGIDGSSGTSGIDGSSGTSGVNGTSGTAGTSGTSGTTGTSGTSGTSGVGYPINGQILSLTNNTIGATGTFVFNLVSPYVSTDFAFASGQYVRAIQQVDAGLNWMEGLLQITSSTQYTLYVDNYFGSGSYNQWSFAIAGADGTSGTSGISGSSGTSGIDGSSGTSGSNGSSGTTGTSGTSGIDGTSGTSGANGSNGTSGTSGSSGIVTALNSVIKLTASNLTVSTVNTSSKMFGVAQSFTPTSTGKVLVTFSGVIDMTGGAGLKATVRLSYGTGTAPSTNSVATGTLTGNISEGWNDGFAFTCTTILDGLSVGTTYWFDLTAITMSTEADGMILLSNSQINTVELTGVQGPAGTSGSVGTSGTSGSTGTSGTSGQDGTFFGSSGTSGSSGLTGTSGTSGNTGSSGTSGISGSSGTSGANGSNGTSGTSGFSGVNGTNGTSGTSGTGTNGTSGTSGISTAYVTPFTKTSNYTIALVDTGNLVEMSSGSSLTLTVPLSGTVDFPIGSQILVARGGTGEVNIAETAGVVFRSANNYKRLYSQFSGATLVKVAADIWYIFGDLKA